MSNANRKKTQKKSGRLSELNPHSLEIEAVLGKVESGIEGLSAEEAERRASLYGKNAFTEKLPPGILFRVYEQLKSPLAAVLVIAFLLTILLREFIDATVIAFALSIAVVVGVIQEGRASKAFKALKDSQVKTATVIRGGKKHVVEAHEVVPGDIVEIHDGEYVPADIRLLETRELHINESSLTGEWLTAEKHTEVLSVGAPLAERKNMAWMGTFISRGYGVGVVVGTGDQTEIGRLAKTVQETKDADTPLQKEMARVSRIMLYVIIAIVAAIFVLGVFRGETIEGMLLTSIAIAVASIPEGLPAAVTIILAIGMETLLRRGGLVRNLLAAETLGSTSMILTDKTGTLTEAKMEITCVISSNQRTEEKCDLDHSDEVVREILNVSLCASNAFLDEGTKEGGEDVKIVGDPLERAVFYAAQEAGLTVSGGSYRASRVDYLSFTSERRFAAGITKVDDGLRLCINGAPEYLLEASTKMLGREGVKQMSVEARKFFEEKIDEHTDRGERLVAVAFKETDAPDIDESDTSNVLEDITFAGLLVFHDPVRQGVLEAIQKVKHAGAKVVLVTGDNPKTALTIARITGIAGPKDKALLGADIEEMTDKQLLKVLKKTKVFARVLPNEKMRLASVLQDQDEIVAMTGDGVNDAPALQKANIGVSLGAGTEVAKEASDLVLVNNTFETIVAAVEEGRRVVSNLRKVVGYLLTTSLSEVVLIGTALLIGAPVPILPSQILWGNIIEEGLMSVSYAFEPSNENTMNKPVEDIREEGILSKQMLSFIGMVLVVASILLVVFYLFVHSFNLPIEKVRSIMFFAVTVDSLFIAFSFRSLHTPIWKLNLLSNKFFIISFCVSTFLFALVITVPFLSFMFSYEPLSFVQISGIIAYGLLMLITIEIGKWIFFERKKV